jgi:hypothetical protein
MHCGMGMKPVCAAHGTIRHHKYSSICAASAASVRQQQYCSADLSAAMQQRRYCSCHTTASIWHSTRAVETRGNALCALQSSCAGIIDAHRIHVEKDIIQEEIARITREHDARGKSLLVNSL